MTLDAPTYFAHLRSYVNDHYVMHDGAGGEVVLKEKYFPPPPATRAETRPPFRTLQCNGFNLCLAIPNAISKRRLKVG